MEDKIKNITNLSFEEALKELEIIVEKIEVSEAGLDESIANYEYGIELKKFLYEKLDSAKLKIDKISNNN